MKKELPSTRKLAAIMFTDIVGYTKLMGENEDKALQLLVKNKAIQKSLVKKYNGRWLKEIGDGTLSSFNSALEAVYCANKIMEAYKDDPNIKLRIGIHIGDVTFSDGDVYGDGVNIASRLEQYAQSSEIIISDVVYRNIKNIEGINVEYVDEVQPKNVDAPLRIYRVGENIAEHEGNILTTLSEYTDIKKRSPLKTVGLLAGLVLILIVSYFFVFEKIPTLGKLGSANTDKTVAVIQFENPGGQDQSAYSAGISEDVLVQLMKIHELEVIQQPRNYVMDSLANYEEIGKELGVAHLLLGSVWKKDDHLSVFASLIDTQSGQPIWSNKWNKPFEDIFNIQTEIAISIAEALKATITNDEVEQIERRPTMNMTAYDLYYKGREYYLRYTDVDNLNAMGLFTQALKLDPDFTLAHAGLSDVFSQLAQRSHVKEFWLDSAYYHAMLVTEKEPGLSNGHKSLGLYYSIIGDSKKAMTEFELAVEIDNNLDAVINLSRIYYRTGQMDKSLEILNNARSKYPLNENLLFNFGATYYRLNDFKQANEYIDGALIVNPGHINSLLLKWFMAVLTGNTDASYATANKLGYFSNDNMDQVLVILQNEIGADAADKTNAAETMRGLMDNRELDFIDIPYLFVLINEIYLMGGLEARASELFQYKINYNQNRIENGEIAYKFYYEIAQIYGVMGEKEKAYEYLNLSVEHGWSEYLFGYLDPSFRDFVNEDRFQELINMSREHVNSIQNKVLRMDKI